MTVVNRYIILWLLCCNVQVHAKLKPVDDLCQLGIISDNVAPLNMVGVVHFKGMIDEAYIKKTLTVLQQRHVMLATKVVLEPSPCFSQENVPEIPFQMVERQQPDTWKDVVAQQLNDRLPLLNGPLVRLIYIAGATEGEIVWVYNHIIADGISRTHISIEFFEIIHALKNNEPISLKPDNAWKADIFSILGEQRETLKNRTYSLLFDSYKRDNKRTCLIVHDFSEQETEAIKNAYRIHQCSLQSVLTACMAQVLADYIQSQGNIGLPSMVCHHPINIRPFLSPVLQPSDVGDLITFIDREVTVDLSGNMWDLAYKIKKDLYACIKTNKHFSLFSHATRILNGCRSAQEVFDYCWQSKPMVIVSQVGTWNIRQDYGDLYITSVRGVFNWVGRIKHKDTFIVTGLIMNDKLMLTFVYSPELMTHDKACEMADAVVTKLKSSSLLM